MQLWKKEKRSSFGMFLSSLEQTPRIEEVQRKYKLILESDDFTILRERRHNFFAHNALNPRDTQHTYSAVFEMSEDLEDLYDEVVLDEQVDAIPWEGEIHPAFVHPNNCSGGIEENTNEFFMDLKR